MRKLWLLAAFLSAGTLHAQDVTKVKKVVLDNGFTILLNEDHTSPEIYGAVAVKAGGKYDPHDATGMGHYLEHMLFKGTQTMGTWNYASEKPLLDSINLLYDQLGATQDKKQRDDIQAQINDVSVRAAQYAVPNEFDKLVKSIGGTGVNAMTGFEEIVYYNQFPNHQWKKWIELYASRFEKPVFRLFQSELETVYEEKNKAMDEMGYKLFRDFQKRFFKVHPYGQQDILGETEHLKNPSLTKMYQYYNTYYVPNNMALILTGDFNSDEVLPFIRERFGKWQSKEVPKFPEYTEQPFKGREFFHGRYLPVRVGVSAYRVPPQNHPDNFALEIYLNLLTNSNGTGVLDKLTDDNKLMESTALDVQLNDGGGVMVMFVPKLIGQSLHKAEKLVVGQLNKLNSGGFTDEQLQVIKDNLVVQFERRMESKYSRGTMLVNAFTSGQSWDYIMAYPDKIRNVTRQQVEEVGKRYFGENRLVMYSRTGIPKKDKLKKPNFKPVAPSGSHKSEYAAYFDSLPNPAPIPHIVDLEKDALTLDLGLNAKGYYTVNPLNDVFSLHLYYQKGGEGDPKLALAAQYLNKAGSETMKSDSFKREMAKLACTYNIYGGTNYVVIMLQGLESNAEKAIALMNQLITSPGYEEDKWKKIVKEARLEKRFSDKDVQTAGQALRSYMLVGNKSSYLTGFGPKATKKLELNEVIAEWKATVQYRPEIYLTGRMGPEGAVAAVKPLIPTGPVKWKDSLYVTPPKAYAENTVLLLDVKDARQSQIYFYVAGDTEQVSTFPVIHAFNSYFGEDMSSLVFQEIREFRSLAYTAQSSYSSNYVRLNPQPGRLTAYIGCQGDKTLEAIEVMHKLIDSMPMKPERIETIRSGLMEKAFNNNSGFRYIAFSIDYWKTMGYKEDPAKTNYEAYQKLTFEDIETFYQKRFPGKPVVIAIAGDAGKFDRKALERWGKVIEVKRSQVMND